MPRACCNWRGEVFGEQAAPLEPAFLAAWPRPAPTCPSAGDGAQIYKEQVATKELRPGAGGGPLRHQLRLLFLCRRDGSLLLPRLAQLLRHLHLRPRTPGAGPGQDRQRHHRPAARASPLRYCISATRTSPPPSKPTSRSRCGGLRGLCRAGRRAVCSAPTFPR